ncbi:MAG: hypothetical protein HC822_21780 [Oscillochloris sp.]|nr:hypothetical protein [Oscillochloris sp.]
MTLSVLFYDLLVTATIVLAGTGLGALALKLFPVAEPGIFGIWLRTAAGLGLLAMLMLLLGFARLYTPLVVIPLTVAPALFGLWALIAALRANRAAGGLFPAGVSGVRGWPDSLAYVLFVLIAASTWIWIGLTHSLLPPADWDTVSYHLALPKLYIEPAN